MVGRATSSISLKNYCVCLLTRILWCQHQFLWALFQSQPAETSIKLCLSFVLCNKDWLLLVVFLLLKTILLPVSVTLRYYLSPVVPHSLLLPIQSPVTLNTHSLGAYVLSRNSGFPRVLPRPLRYRLDLFKHLATSFRKIPVNSEDYVPWTTDSSDFCSLLNLFWVHDSCSIGSSTAAPYMWR